MALMTRLGGAAAAVRTGAGCLGRQAVSRATPIGGCSGPSLSSLSRRPSGGAGARARAHGGRVALRKAAASAGSVRCVSTDAPAGAPAGAPATDTRVFKRHERIATIKGKDGGQGLTLVHFSAQLERFVCDRGCA